MSPTPYMVPEDAAGPLTDQEKRIVQRLFSSWQEVPLDFKRALSNSLMTDEDLALNTTQIFDLDRKLRAANNIATSVYASASGGGANTDLPWAWGPAQFVFIDLGTAGGGTMRSVGAPPNLGARIVFRNSTTPAITLKHNLAGGTGVILYNRSLADIVLQPGETVEYVYATSNVWVEVTRDQASAGRITGSLKGTGTIAILAGSGFSFVRNSTGNYTVTFTTAFAAVPVAFVVVRNNQPVANTVTTLTAAAFTCQFSVASTGVAQDQDFDFLVHEML